MVSIFSKLSICILAVLGRLFILASFVLPVLAL